MKIVRSIATAALALTLVAGTSLAANAASWTYNATAANTGSTWNHTASSQKRVGYSNYWFQPSNLFNQDPSGSVRVINAALFNSNASTQVSSSKNWTNSTSSKSLISGLSADTIVRLSVNGATSHDKAWSGILVATS